MDQKKNFFFNSNKKSLRVQKKIFGPKKKFLNNLTKSHFESKKNFSTKTNFFKTHLQKVILGLEKKFWSKKKRFEQKK